MIEVNNLTKQYGAFTAVKGISFTAQPGQVTGFLGPNGAGKTTTMRILTGFMPPSSGSASVAGFDVFENSRAVRERVGYLPENVPLYRDMSAIDYLMYLAEIRGLRQRRERAEVVLARVGLSSRAYSLIRSLSKGMRQRVGLAAALIHDPEVLILDEPTIGLDPLQVLELRQLVRELGHDHTVLFSTHILSEAEQVCDKLVIINQGRILAEGAPADLRSSLSRGGRVLLRVEGDLHKALAAVRDVAGIQDAQIERDSIVVTPRDAQSDPRAELARHIVQQGIGLIEIRPLAVNLEEIFLEVTRHEGATSQAKAAAAEATPVEEVNAS